MYKLENFIYKTISYICGILILFITLLIFWQVFCRYALNNSLTWSEELGRYVFVWITFLGLPIALKAKAHVALDILLTRVHGKAKKILITINSILTLFLAFVITYSGVVLISLGFNQVSSAMVIPMYLVYLVMPISGILLIFFSITTLISDLKNCDKTNIIQEGA